jgi:hypothetical protein
MQNASRLFAGIFYLDKAIIILSVKDISDKKSRFTPNNSNLLITFAAPNSSL